MKENILKTKTILNKMFDLVHESQYDGAYLTAEILDEYYRHLQVNGYSNKENIDIHRCVRDWRNLNDPTTPKTFEKYLILSSIFNCDFKDIVFLDADTDERDPQAFDFLFTFDAIRKSDNLLELKINLPRIRDKIYKSREMFAIDENCRQSVNELMKRRLGFDGMSLLDKTIRYIKKHQLNRVSGEIIKKLESTIFIWKNRRQPPSVEQLIMFEEITGISIMEMYNPTYDTIHVQIPVKKEVKSELELFNILKVSNEIKDRVRLYLKENEYKVVSIKKDCIIFKYQNKYGALLVGEIIRILPPKYFYLTANNTDIIVVDEHQVHIINKSDQSQIGILESSTGSIIAADVKQFIRVKNISRSYELMGNIGYQYYEIEGGIIVAKTDNMAYLARIEEGKNGRVIKRFVDGKVGFGLIVNSKFVLPPIYEKEIGFGDGIYTVVLNGKYGFLNIDGKELIAPKFDRASVFSQGLVAVCQDGKYGYINSKGEVVIPFQYDFASDFSEGLAAVSLNGKDGYIDQIGNIVIPFSFDSGYKFSEGVAVVEKNGLYGYIDKTGNFVLPCIYGGASACHNGVVEVLSCDLLITKRINNAKINLTSI